MDVILNSVIPLFSVIFIGYLAGRIRMMDDTAVRTLVRFVFNIAMPALLFRMMATADIQAINDWAILLAYLLAQIPIFILGMLMGGFLFRQSFAEMTIQGFGSSFSNGVILGLPLALSIYGEQGGIAALLIIMLDILLFSVTTLLLEIATFYQRKKTSLWRMSILADAAISIVKNPLILASVFGLLWGLLGIDLPSVVDRTLVFTGQAAPPAGLFALGASLSVRSTKGSLWPTSTMVGLKLVLHPLTAWLILTYGFNLSPVFTGVAILFAACPVGANAYVFAQQYEAGVTTSATAVLVSTALAIVTISALALSL